jgi:hypothetical protein
MRIYPDLTPDGEFKKLSDLGHTGALNDRQFSFLRSLSLTNSLADMMSSWASTPPIRLFSEGETGVWFDPSDLSTLRQLSTTTQAVTTVGQSVAYMLNKTRPLTLGSELVTNGGFDVSSGWTLSSGASISGGKLVFSGVAAFGGVSQAISLNSTKLYECKISVESVTNLLRFRFSIGGIVITAPEITAPGSYTFLLSPNSTGSVTLQIVAGPAASTNAVIDNVSIKELSGTHAIQSTVGSRPTLRRNSGGIYYLEDDVDNAISWAAPAGTYTVVFCDTAGSVTVQTSQSLSGATDALRATQTVGYLAINRALTAKETADLTNWFKAKAGVAS